MLFIAISTTQNQSDMQSTINIYFSLHSWL